MQGTRGDSGHSARSVKAEQTRSSVDAEAEEELEVSGRLGK